MSLENSKHYNEECGKSIYPKCHCSLGLPYSLVPKLGEIVNLPAFMIDSLDFVTALLDHVRTYLTEKCLYF